MPPIAVDNFGRADTVANCGTDWSLCPGTADMMNIVSRAIGTQTVGNRTIIVYSSGQPPNDQYAKATVVAVASDVQSVCIRLQMPHTTRNYYCSGHQNTNFGGGTTVSRLTKEVANVLTSLATGPTLLAAGMIHWCEAQGTTLTMRLLNGGPAEAVATDLAFSSGYAGIYVQANALGSLYSTFEVGQIAVSAAPSTSTRYAVSRVAPQQRLEAAMA